jgi:hypothetical protein
LTAYNVRKSVIFDKHFLSNKKKIGFSKIWYFAMTLGFGQTRRIDRQLHNIFSTSQLMGTKWNWWLFSQKFLSFHYWKFIKSTGLENIDFSSKCNNFPFAQDYGQKFREANIIKHRVPRNFWLPKGESLSERLISPDHDLKISDRYFNSFCSENVAEA